MKNCGGSLTGLLLAGALCVHGLPAQTGAGATGQHPVSTKPEGAGQTCSYSGTAGSGGAASSTSSCSPGTTPAAAQTPAASTQRFPFPGETAPAAQPAQQVSPASATPGAPAQAGGQRFPFPGETTPDVSSVQDGPPLDPTDTTDTPRAPLRDAGSSGDASDSRGSSSSSSSSSSRGAGLDNPDAGPDLPEDNPNAPMPTARRAARRKLPKDTKPLTPEEQESEDVQVAGFYQNDGNFKAAYERAKEAVGLIADDADAHLALAEAARKLGKLDEAETNYKKALALDPVPKTRRAAERALKEMSGS